MELSVEQIRSALGSYSSGYDPFQSLVERHESIQEWLACRDDLNSIIWKRSERNPIYECAKISVPIMTDSLLSILSLGLEEAFPEESLDNIYGEIERIRELMNDNTIAEDAWEISASEGMELQEYFAKEFGRYLSSPRTVGIICRVHRSCETCEIEDLRDVFIEYATRCIELYEKRLENEHNALFVKVIRDLYSSR